MIIAFIDLGHQSVYFHQWLLWRCWIFSILIAINSLIITHFPLFYFSALRKKEASSSNTYKNSFLEYRCNRDVVYLRIPISSSISRREGQNTADVSNTPIQTEFPTWGTRIADRFSSTKRGNSAFGALFNCLGRRACIVDSCCSLLSVSFSRFHF